MEGFITGFCSAALWLVPVYAGWIIRAAFSIPLNLGDG